MTQPFDSLSGGDQISRRALLAKGAGGSALGLAVLMAGYAGSSRAAALEAHRRSRPRMRTLTKFTLQLSWLPSVEWGGSYLAREGGYFADEGLDVTILPGGPQVAVEPLIATGKAQVGMTYGVGVASANKNGADIRIIGGDLQTNPNGIASLAEAPIAAPKDLEGKTLGVSTTGMTSMKAFLTAAGVDLGQVKFVPVQSSLQPLADHQVDALGCFLPETATLAVSGIKTHFMLRSDFGPVDVEDAYGATTHTIESRRDELHAFIRAQRRGWQEFIKDPAGAARLVVGRYGSGAGLNLAEQSIEARDYVSLVAGAATARHDLLYLSAATQESALRAIAQAGIGRFSRSELFDDSVFVGATAS